jgi:hypothetical protein
MSENEAIPSTVINHRNLSQDAGILLAASLSKNLFSVPHKEAEQNRDQHHQILPR